MFAPDECTTSIFKVTELVRVNNKMMEWNKICHLSRKSVWIQPVTALKGWEVQPSKTKKWPPWKSGILLFTFTSLCSWSGVTVNVAQRLTIRWTVWSSNPSGDVVICSHLDQPQGPTSLLYIGYWIFPWGNEARAWHW